MTPALTPVERRGPYWVKRDDLFDYGGAVGGKARACVALAAGARGLVTAGSRSSPQCGIVARVAARMGVPAALHCPSGPLGPELEAAAAYPGVEVIQHRPGYNTVIVARARADAAARGWREIPFGMECEEQVEQTAAQTANLPAGAGRLIVPVGSGMSLAGILHGLLRANRRIPVVGIWVGAVPYARLDRWAPLGWPALVDLRQSRLAYEEEAAVRCLDGLQLDPIYEAKCIGHLQPGDCLWVVGIRATLR